MQIIRKADLDTSPKSDLMNEIEVATYLKFSRSYLRRMRMDKTGPRFFKLGSSVRYSLADLKAWVEANVG